MVKIFTVHGTFAGDASDSGQKWWQKGSPFLTRLQAQVEEPLDIEPHHWSGANSELDRRKAASSLAKKIARSGEPPLVIGHSHGGSVGIHTLALLAIHLGARARDKVAGLVTIGTPMILFRSNWNPFTRFNLFGRIMLLIGLSLGLLYSVGMLADIFAPNQFRRPLLEAVPDNLMRFFSAPEPWLAVIVLLALWVYSRRTAKRQKLFSTRALRTVFAGRFRSLSHWQDEAIRALTHARTLTPKLVQLRNLFAGAFSFLAFGMLILQFGSQILGAALSERHFYGPDPVIGEPVPRAFILGDTRTPIEIAPDARSFRLYDMFRAGEAYTRLPYRMIPVRQLWDSDRVDALLETDEGAWLASFRDSLPEDRGVVFIPVDAADASERRSASDEFADWLEKVAPFGPGADIEFRDLFESGEEERLRFEDAAQYFYLFTMPNADWRDAVDGRYMSNAMMSWLFSDAAHSEFGIHDDMVGILPHSALVRVPFQTGVWLNTCNIPVQPKFIDGIRDQRWERWDCVSLFSRGTRPLYHFIWNFDSGKYEILRLIATGGSQSGNVPARFSRLAYASPEDFFWMVGLNDHPDNYGKPLYAHRQFLFSLVLVTILIAVSAFIAAIFALIMRPVLNGILTGTLKSTAYGNDGFGEQIVDVCSDVDFDNRKVGNLPDDVSEEIIENSLADAPAAIGRIRTLLGGGELTALGGADPLSVATRFEDSELIHNAYFHSPRFIRYLGAVLIEQFGLTPSAEFQSDPAANDYRLAVRKSLDEAGHPA